MNAVKAFSYTLSEYLKISTTLDSRKKDDLQQGSKEIYQNREPWLMKNSE